MYIVLSFSLVALLLTYFEQKGNLKNGMLLGFAIVFVISALRYNYGNDYVGYHDIYNEIIKYPLSFQNLIDNQYRQEPGWVVVNYCFQYFGGFFTLIAVIALIENVIYYRFIRKYVPTRWWTLAVFIYLFSTNFYLLNMSMLRQGLAIALFLLSFDYIKDRRLFISLFIIALAWTFHKSALILAPFVFLPYVIKRHETSVIFAIAIGALFVVLMINPQLASHIMGQAMAVEDIENYVEYYGQDTVSVKYGLGFAINLIPFLVSVYYLLSAKYVEPWNYIVVTLAAMSTLIIPFGEIVPLVGRVGMYFKAFQIAAMPIIFGWLPQKELSRFVMILYIAMIIYGYWGFFHDPTFQQAYSEYHTILDLI